MTISTIVSKQCFYALYNADGVPAGLSLHVNDDRWRLVHPGGLIGVLHSVHNLRHVGEHGRRTISIGDHHFLIVLAGDQLIVGVNLVVLSGTVKVATRGCGI